MKTIQQLIAEAREKYDKADYTTLAEVQAVMSGPISLEEKSALYTIAAEITEVLNRQILAQYLTQMGIPESQWVEYSYNGTGVIHHVE